MALSFFLLLLLGHMLGDFVLQPYWLVLAKRNGWPGLFIHVGVVAFITAILLSVSAIPNWWVWVIVLFLAHLLIDQFRTFVFTNNSKGRGLLLLLADQLVHLALIALLAWLATGWTFADLGALITPAAANEHRLMAYLIGLATLMGLVPVLEVEIAVLVLSLGGTHLNHTVQVDFSDRVLGTLERAVGVILLLLGYGWLFPLVFLPRLGFMMYRGQAKPNPSPMITKVVVSVISALLVAYALSYVLPPVLPFI